jgi:Bacterial Ig-like domain (group 3)
MTFRTVSGHIRRTHARSFAATTLVALLVMAGSAAHAAPFTVANTNNTGVGSLRQAIIDSNTASPGPNTIDFTAAGTVNVASALPAISVPVTINGYSAPLASVNTNAFGAADNAVLTFILNGGGLAFDGLVLQNHTSSTIRGLVIRNFGGNGIQIAGTGGGHTIAGCFIGTNAAGTAGGPGNGADGVFINGVAGNTIGGVNPADRNIISANGQPNVFAGVDIRGTGATGNLVQGNYIGTTASGAAALGNSTTFGFGVLVANGASTNTIGGAVAGAGNVISANGGALSVQGGADTCADNVIAGNLIGTNAAGTGALGNTYGIGTIAYTSGTRIGGTTAAERNVISANANDGIMLGGSHGIGTLVQGNFIGTDITGTAPLGNIGCGIRVLDSTGSAVIGGMAAGAGNVIANNTGIGVSVYGSGVSKPHAFAILGNSIHDNGGLGIDLGNDGVTPNGSGPTGPNNFQNYPVLTGVTSGAGWTSIIGTFSSTASTTFRVEFFSSPACDASGNGEGRTYLGFANIGTDGAGNASISMVLPTSVTLGQRVTATATDPGNNTSEFSACATAAAGTLASTTLLISSVNPSLTGQPVTFTATVTGAGPTPVGSVSFYDGATLLGTVALSGGVATFTTGTLIVGTHPMTAVYGGDTNYTGSTSAILNQVVTAFLPTTVPVLGPLGMVLLAALLGAVGFALLRGMLLGA